MTTLKALIASAIGIGVMFLCMLCWSPQARAAAVWDIDIHAVSPSDTFELHGVFTTVGTDLSQGQLVTSFSGVFTDEFEIGQQATLIPLGRTVSAGSGLVFAYDNMFYSTYLPDAFNNNGLLLDAGLSKVNVFSVITLQGYDAHDGLIENVFVDGDIHFDHLTSSVPEPDGVVYMSCGLLWVVRRRMVRWYTRL